MSEPGELPRTVDAELVEPGVETEQDKAFNLGLRSEKAVAGIAVFGWERAGADGVFARAGKQGKAEIVNEAFEVTHQSRTSHASVGQLPAACPDDVWLRAQAADSRSVAVVAVPTIAYPHGNFLGVALRRP